MKGQMGRGRETGIRRGPGHVCVVRESASGTWTPTRSPGVTSGVVSGVTTGTSQGSRTWWWRRIVRTSSSRATSGTPISTSRDVHPGGTRTRGRRGGSRRDLWSESGVEEQGKTRRPGRVSRGTCAATGSTSTLGSLFSTPSKRCSCSRSLHSSTGGVGSGRGGRSTDADGHTEHSPLHPPGVGRPGLGSERETNGPETDTYTPPTPPPPTTDLRDPSPSRSPNRERIPQGPCGG